MCIANMDILLSSLTNADAGLWHDHRHTSRFQLPFSQFSLLLTIS